ncbi:hypothetical protein AYO38_06770 [bacterium SCGC AG-212-C10]|nr:hypothetical protein AYO38_06770 [bacterium SCGC AG-212-C10]
MERTMIHLLGSPGVGKYTIGREVARLIGARLIDNHSIANVIFNVINPDGVTPLPPAIWPRVGKVRAAVLDTICNVAPRESSFVFTNYMDGNTPSEDAVFAEFIALADARGSTFVPVMLVCETTELVRRIAGEDRRQRMKLVDPIEGARINDAEHPFVTTHPNALTLDVTHVPAPASAKAIVAWANRCREAGGIV